MTAVRRTQMNNQRNTNFSSFFLFFFFFFFFWVEANGRGLRSVKIKICINKSSYYHHYYYYLERSAPIASSTRPRWTFMNDAIEPIQPPTGMNAAFFSTKFLIVRCAIGAYVQCQYHWRGRTSWSGRGGFSFPFLLSFFVSFIFLTERWSLTCSNWLFLLLFLVPLVTATFELEYRAGLRLLEQWDSLLVLKESFEEANSQLEWELASQMLLSVVFQQRADNVAESQMRKLKDALAQAEHLQRWLDRRQTLQLLTQSVTILRQERRDNPLGHQIITCNEFISQSLQPHHK